MQEAVDEAKKTLVEYSTRASVLVWLQWVITDASSFDLLPP